MNNFVNRFYFFSKLTTSLILFLLLILLSYLFVKAYLKEKDLNSNNIEFSKLSDKISVKITGKTYFSLIWLPQPKQ